MHMERILNFNILQTMLLRKRKKKYLKIGRFLLFYPISKLGTYVLVSCGRKMGLEILPNLEA